MNFIGNTEDSYINVYQDLLSNNVVFVDNLLTKDYSKYKWLSPKPKINKVIYNPPATVVIWNDGTKTVSKCKSEDTYNPETGFAMCVAKHYFVNDYYKILNKSITITKDQWDEYCKKYAYEISNTRNALNGRLVNLSRVNHLDIEDKFKISRLEKIDDFRKLIKVKTEKNTKEED